jgi:hypothetical protein
MDDGLGSGVTVCIHGLEINEFSWVIPQRVLLYGNIVSLLGILSYSSFSQPVRHLIRFSFNRSVKSPHNNCKVSSRARNRSAMNHTAGNVSRVSSPASISTGLNLSNVVFRISQHIIS